MYNFAAVHSEDLFRNLSFFFKYSSTVRTGTYVFVLMFVRISSMLHQTELENRNTKNAQPEKQMRKKDRMTIHSYYCTVRYQ